VFHVKHEGWTSGDLSSDGTAALDAYERLLLEIAIPRGMVASSDREHLRDRHILDSLRAVPYIRGGGSVIDLGSGAGLPGIPIAVARPDLVLTLAESRQPRAAFLELVVQRLKLTNVHVFPGPVAELPSGGAAVCLARGFGDAARSWAVARDLLSPDGDLIYWAGRSFSRRHAPREARITAIAPATLESGGPIVIMTRQ
jgi:16S rRNA (guanine527-N7)-methyltransferase